MPYTEAQRAEIISRDQAGQSEAEIAREMNLNPFGVKSVLGRLPPRGAARPKKEETAGEQSADGQTPNIKIQVGAPPRAQKRAPAPVAEAVPLVAGGNTSRVEIHRKGSGYLADESPTATLSDIKARFGGGEYEFFAFDEHGKLIGTRRVSIEGPALAGFPLDAGAFPVGYQGAQDRLFDTWERERQADERRRREEREREDRRLELERERMRADAERQERAIQAQQQSTAQQMQMMFQMQTQMLTAVLGASQKSGSVTETIAAFAKMQELFDGGRGDDPTSILISKAPEMLSSIKDLARMRSNPAAAPAAAGEPTAAQISTQQAAEAFHAQLVGEGFTPAEAWQELQRVYVHLDKRIAEKRRLSASHAAARRAPASPAPGGNGAPATAVPAAPTAPPQEAKA